MTFFVRCQRTIITLIVVKNSLSVVISETVIPPHRVAKIVQIQCSLNGTPGTNIYKDSVNITVSTVKFRELFPVADARETRRESGVI